MPDSYDKQIEDLGAKMVTDAYQLKRFAEYYDATVRLEAIGISVPEQMRCLTAHIGWPRLYVDSIEERLDIEGFRLAEGLQAQERLVDWWQRNGLDEESGLGHLDSMVYGRSYITVAAPNVEAGDEPGVPIIRCESPLNMFAETDPRTRKVTRAVRLYSSETDVQEKWATLYLPDRTVPMKQFGGKWLPDGPAVVHNMGVVPVTPLLNRERLSDRYGRSEITPELMSTTDAASRIMMDMQAAAELIAVPQRMLFGVNADEIAPDGTYQEALSAYLSQIMVFDDPDGKAMQFSPAELRNFVDVLEELSKHVAAYTGLPPQYLSFSTENPASAEAIRSAESRLVKKCERKARLFGGAWEEAMRLAVRVIDGDVPTEMYRLETVWRDPSTPTYAAKADAVSKLYANGTGVIPRERARIDLGYNEAERKQMEEWDEKEEESQLARAIDQAAQTYEATGGPERDKAVIARANTGTSTSTGSKPFSSGSKPTKK